MNKETRQEFLMAFFIAVLPLVCAAVWSIGIDARVKKIIAGNKTTTPVIQYIKAGF